MTDSKKRILMAIGALKGGGAETQCRLLCHELVLQGYEVAILTVEGYGAELLTENFKIYKIGSRGKVSFFRRIGNIADAIDDFKPDIIHVWLPEIFVIFCSIIARLKGIPVITARRSSFKSIFKAGSLRDYLNLIGELFSQKIVSNAIVQRKNSLLFYEMFRIKKGEVIPNAISVVADSFSAENSITVNDSNLKILFVGRFITTKRIDILLESFLRLKNNGANISLYLYGGERKNLPQLDLILKKYDIVEDVHFMGFSSEWRKNRGAFDIFAFPSVLEGMSNVILEAMELGLPVLACDIPENKMICENGKNSLLVEPNNQAQFEVALERLIIDKKLRDSLVNNSQETLKKFSIENMVSSYIKVYSAFFTK